MSMHRLIPLFDRARQSREPLVLATVIRTSGSTYAKPGAQMLIASDGEYAGLLSGGCLEGDLREHARLVAGTGAARIVSYDMRSQDDTLFGLGAGCEGAMDILLTRHGPEDGDWQPLDSMERAHRAGYRLRLAFVTASSHHKIPLGSSFPANGELPDFVRGDALLAPLHAAALQTRDNGLSRVDQLGIELFVAGIAPPPRLLLLGGGPDARPVATLAGLLGWRITVVEHRAHYLSADRFPAGTELVEARPTELASAVRLEQFVAAVVMSHHLDSDRRYLHALAHSEVPYVGLLGPAARREKLLGDLGEVAQLLRERLRAPVGLDIGARTPESIALAIVGEVHAALAGRGGRPFSEALKSDGQ
jgi:xanthine/CO dehydrogenase XdhC/CoxF family maturation factor